MKDICDGSVTDEEVKAIKENAKRYQENWKKYLFKLLTNFCKETKSKRASYIIENFEQEISKFIHVVPNEVVDKLNYPVIEQHKIA